MAVIPRTSQQSALLLVAADGAGSAECAAEGAALACTTLVEVVQTYYAEGGLVGAVTRPQVDAWISSMREQIGRQAEEAGRGLRDYACTLLAAVIDETAILALQVGDGAIVVSDGTSYRPLFWPQRGQYANMTNFVTEDDALDKLDMEILPEVPDEIALLTDGLQSLALTYATQGAHTAFFAPMFAPLRAVPRPGDATELGPQLAAFLAGPSLARRTDDDKTLVLATRRPPQLPTLVAPGGETAAAEVSRLGMVPSTEAAATPAEVPPTHVTPEGAADASTAR